MDERSSLAIKLDALVRYAMVNTVSGVLPLYIVTEYPKSGGTWLSQMLADYLDIPFPRNRSAVWKSSVIHGHMLYTPAMNNVICLFRDGRDCMVSWYYHALFHNEKNSPSLVKSYRKDLQYKDFDDIMENLPHFIEYVFETNQKSRSPFKFTWAQFARSWYEKDCAKAKYEDLVHDANFAMQELLEQLIDEQVDVGRLSEIVQKYSFSQQAKRQPGKEIKTSFLRKGVPGDWKEKFSKASAETFNYYAGKELVYLGYEKDSEWVYRLD